MRTTDAHPWRLAVTLTASESPATPDQRPPRLPAAFVGAARADRATMRLRCGGSNGGGGVGDRPSRRSVPLLLLCAVLCAVLCAFAAATAGVDAAACAPTTPLVDGDEIPVAILVHAKAPAGVLPDHPFRSVGAESSIYAGILTPMLQGTDLYVESMKAQGSMPLRNGVSVRFRYVYINLGYIDWNNATASATAAAPTIIGMMTRVATPAFAAALGGPFPLIIAPLLTPAVMLAYLFNLCEDNGSCINILPFYTSWQLLQCVEGEPDCVRRNRLPGARRFDSVLSVDPDSSDWQSVPLEQCHTLGVKTLYILGEASVSNSTYIHDVAFHTAKLASDLALEVLNVELMVHCSGATCGGAPPGSRHVFAGGQSARDMAAKLKSANPDALFMLFGPTPAAYPAVNALFEGMREISWMPKLISWNGGAEPMIGPYLSDPSFLAHHLTVSVFHTAVKSASYRNEKTPVNFELHPSTPSEDGPAVFARAFNTRFRGDYPAGYAFDATGSAHYPLLGYTSLVVAQKLVEQALTSQVRGLLAASERLSVPSPLVLVDFSTKGTLSKSPILLQFAPPQPRIEPTASAAAAAAAYEFNIIVPYNVGLPPVFPLPTWEERVFAPKFYAEPSEQAVLAVASAGILGCLGVLAAIWVHRDAPVMRAATPSFCALVVLGSAAMLASLFFSTLHVDDSHCAATAWLLSLGFSLTFGSLFAKTFRVWKLLDADRLHAVRLSELDLLLAVGMLLGGDVVVNAAWAGVVGMNAEVTVVDPVRPGHNYYACDWTSDAGMPFVAAHLALKGGLLLLGALLAYKVRAAPSHFNESTFISLCIYNTAIALCFILPILGAGLRGREGVFLFRSFSVVFIAVSTVAILFAPKFIAIKRRASIYTSNGVGGAGAKPPRVRGDRNFGDRYAIPRMRVSFNYDDEIIELSSPPVGEGENEGSGMTRATGEGDGDAGGDTARGPNNQAATQQQQQQVRPAAPVPGSGSDSALASSSTSAFEFVSVHACTAEEEIDSLSSGPIPVIAGAGAKRVDTRSSGPQSLQLRLPGDGGAGGDLDGRSGAHRSASIYPLGALVANSLLPPMSQDGEDGSSALPSLPPPHMLPDYPHARAHALPSPSPADSLAQQTERASASHSSVDTPSAASSGSNSNSSGGSSSGGNSSVGGVSSPSSSSSSPGSPEPNTPSHHARGGGGGGSVVEGSGASSSGASSIAQSSVSASGSASGGAAANNSSIVVSTPTDADSPHHLHLVIRHIGPPSADLDSA